MGERMKTATAAVAPTVAEKRKGIIQLVLMFLD